VGRWLVAVVIVVGALAAGAVAFLNGGDAVTIRLTPSRSTALPLGTALALAFATGVAAAGVLALGGAAARSARTWRARRVRERAAARLQRERVHAESLLARGAADEARTRLSEAVEAHGADERLLELLAGASEWSGDLPGAIAAVEEARRGQPKRPLLARRLRALYVAAGRWEDALALESDLLLDLRSPAALADETAVFCGLRYEAAMADPDQDRGLRRLLALVREHPSFVPAWVAAGDRLRAAGRLFRARHAYERGARIRPAAPLLDRLVAVHTEAGRPDRARSALRRLHARHPDDTALTAHLVRIDLRDGALDDAEALLAALPTDAAAPATIEALRGEVCRRKGQAEQALVHFARAAAEHLAPTGTQRCRACGQVATVWAARCARCGRWNTLDEDSSADLMPVPSRSAAGDHCVEDAPG